MKKCLGPIIVMLVFAVASHFALTLAAPKLVMGVAIKKIEKTAHDTAIKRNVDMTGFTTKNRPLHGEPRTAKTREVVAPNPNMLFSVILYDVSKGPLLIESPVPESYWSISFFADNTDNYYVLNEQQVDSDRVKLLLVGAGLTSPDMPGMKIVKAQTDQGIVLFRYLINDQEHYKAMDRLRQTTVVKQM